MFFTSVGLEQATDFVTATYKAQRFSIGGRYVDLCCGLGGDLGKPDCTSMFMCGAPFENKGGSDSIANPSIDKAKALLAEAGYKNEKIVVLHPLDSPLLNPFGAVLIDRMKKAGFKRTKVENLAGPDSMVIGIK